MSGFAGSSHDDDMLRDMTVSDLITELLQHDPNAVVLFRQTGLRSSDCLVAPIQHVVPGVAFDFDGYRNLSYVLDTKGKRIPDGGTRVNVVVLGDGKP